MVQKNIIWQEFYKLPLSFDGYTYAWDNKYEMVLEIDSHEATAIIDVINGGVNRIVETFIYKDGAFFKKDTMEYVFQIIGWKRLTRLLNDNLEQATEIQDEFGKFILEKLNNEK